MSSTNTPTLGPLDPADATPLPLQPGDLVAGRYEVLRLLGSGGSAVVYAVRDLTIGDEIALKLLREGKRSDIDVERSRREAEFARGSASPRLVRTFDLTESHGLVFLTMELVPGGSLRDLLRRDPLPIDEVIRLACEILEALVDLHRLDIVHRDLKPGNLLLTTDGHIKLSDFGIARRWTDDESRLTVTGLPVGTVDYLSPEQAAAEKVDPRSDLFSFGIVLFEMLTGRVPFEAPTAVSSIVMRLRRRAENVRAMRRDTPRWLAAIVARLLETKRDQRYESAEAALEDLRRHRARVHWRWSRAAIVLLLLAAVSFGVWRLPRARDPQFVPNGDWGMRVIDAGGDTLWTRPDTSPHHAVIVRRGDVKEIAAIVAPSSERAVGPVFSRTVSFLDLRTGRVVRKRSLPSAASLFPDHSDRFGVAQVRAMDLNGDGYDEVAVVYTHDYWPCYVVMHDLRRDEGRVIFVASGHHRIEQTEDVDGDGVADLIFAGISNRMGWYVGLAAIRVHFDMSSDDYDAYTPDRVDLPRSRSLIWYALIPPGSLRVRDVAIDRKRRVLRVNYRTRAPVDMTFDGFAATSKSTVSPAQREVDRERVYAHLRDAKRLARSGDAQAAIAEAEAAQLTAARIGDFWLHEWSQRVKATAFVQAGRFADGAALFTRLCNGSEAAADIAWDAGTAFHLAGELPRAVEWYRRSLGREGRPWIGRLKYESIQGLVLALGEMGRWEDALKEVDVFTAAYTAEAGDAKWYRRYVTWRTGGQSPAEYEIERPHDLVRYWALEIALARGANPGEMLKMIDLDRRRASETRTLLLLARSEALRRSGQTNDALQAAREAFDTLRGERRTDTLARAHFDLAAERLVRLAEAKGLHNEANRVRAEAAALRWHPNGMAP